MFGEMHLPKYPKRVRPRPVPVEIHMPLPTTTDCWAHPGRPAATDQHVKLLLYKQRKDGDYARTVEEIKAGVKKDIFSAKFDKHVIKRRFQCELQKRLKHRLEEYDEAIDKRREKLRDVFAEEEKRFYWETVDLAQRGGETASENLIKRSELLIAKREGDREETVKQKRLQQYMLRCEDMRGALAKKHLIESKNGQLQQMRENEARREAERELDQMWHNVTMKEIDAKREREEYDALDRMIKDKVNTAVWDMQVQAQEHLKQEVERIAKEDQIELEKLQEQLKREQIEALLAKQQKRVEIKRDLDERLALQEQFLEQRHKEEKALEDAFTLLTQIELDRERAKVQDMTTATKREMAQYRASLAQLAIQKQEEEKMLQELLDGYKVDIQKKQDVAKCKIEAAKKKLHADVLKGRAEQLRYKQEIADEERKQQLLEDELVAYVNAANEKLAEEAARQRKLAREQYRDDLTKQIEYNQLLEDRRQQEMERELAAGREEQERYESLVSDICSLKITAAVKHPFRRLVDRYDCNCPDGNGSKPAPP